MKNFTLMILCAGFGSRMLNLTRSTPKPLLKYKNKVLLKNTIDFFTNIGCDEILINTHYLHNKIKKYLDKNFKKYPIKIIYEKKILGTGGGVKNIFNHTKRKNICVVNSDIFWTKKNKSHIQYFLGNYREVSHCKMLLSKDINFLGLKKGGENKFVFCPYFPNPSIKDAATLLCNKSPTIDIFNPLKSSNFSLKVFKSESVWVG